METYSTQVQHLHIKMENKLQYCDYTINSWTVLWHIAHRGIAEVINFAHCQCWWFSVIIVETVFYIKVYTTQKTFCFCWLDMCHESRSWPENLSKKKKPHVFNLSLNGTFFGWKCTYVLGILNSLRIENCWKFYKLFLLNFNKFFF